MKELIAKLKALFERKDKPATDDEILEILNEAKENGSAINSDDLQKVIEAINAKNNPGDDSDNEVIKALKTENSALLKKLEGFESILTELKKDRDNGVEAQKAQMEKERLKRREDFIAKGLKDGKIIESTKEKWEKLFDKDEDLCDNMYKESPVHPEFKPDEKGGGNNNNENNNNNPNRGIFKGAPTNVLEALNKMETN